MSKRKKKKNNYVENNYRNSPYYANYHLINNFFYEYGDLLNEKLLEKDL